MSLTTNELHAALARDYGISAEFCARYLADNGLDLPGITDPEAFRARLGETQRLYLDYALSTNRRGAQIVAQYEPLLRPRESRILDIGCGQGGTVRAFISAGYEAVGVEIDAQLADYARLNLGDEANRVHCADILDFPLDRLGRFDLILCSDVIEHVGNPDALVEVAARLLAPGGRFVLQVPNRDSIHQVLADGHFRIFGMTLLSRQEGRELKRQLQGWDDPYDHMGEHMPASHYLRHMRMNGLEAVIREATLGSFDDALTLFGDACGRMAWMLAHAGLSWFTRRELSRAFADYGQRFLTAHSEAVLEGDPQSFALQYLEPVWTITGRRLAGEQASTTDG